MKSILRRCVPVIHTLRRSFSSEAFVALGSNVGDRSENISNALKSLRSLAGQVTQTSHLLRVFFFFFEIEIEGEKMFALFLHF